MADQDPSQENQQPSAMSDADKIRAKRLAKLGGPSVTPQDTSAPATVPGHSPSPAVEAKPSPPAASAPAPAQNPLSSSSNPFSQLLSTENRSAPRITIKPKQPEPARSSSNARGEDMGVWTNRTLGGIFRATLDPNNTRDAHGHRLYFVSGVKGDLEEENKPLHLTTDILDQAILESASNQTESKPLEYLLSCWKRASRLFRGMHNKNDPKYEVAREARRICFNYCIFAATMPDMFGAMDTLTPTFPLAEHLLADPESDRGLCHDFINEAVSRFNDEENGAEVKQLLVETTEEISRRLAKLSMNDEYKPYILAMRNFVRYPALLAAISQSPSFLPPDVQTHRIESRTLLGPFFRLSPMQGEVALNYFSNHATRDKGYIANSQNALRMTLQTHQDELFDIANCFIKSSKESRERILDWFALSVNANHKRRALQVDAKTVSSDGFMVNVTVILDRLCEPFMDATFSKIDRIDIDYLRRSPRVNIADETKINADQQTSDDFYAVAAGGVNNFITEVFFLTVAAHHYGTEAVNTKVSQLQKDVKWLEKQLAKMETERHKYISNPAQLAVFDAHLKRMKDQIERGHCTFHATQGVLLDDTTQARSMQFMRYIIVWLLRLVSPTSNFPQKPLSLPLPKDQSIAFKCLPEYFLEDIVDNFKFITRYMPHIITSTQCEELVMICITFLRSTEYIKNPYLKSGLVTILFHGVWPFDRRSKGILGDVLFAHPFATKHLLHALMKFYIECESTGASSQFYDKFNIRYEIFQVVKCIWPNTIYRDNLATEARVNLDFFVQFVNLLLNDVTYVLDESFTAFAQIHDVSKILKNAPENMDQNERQAQEEKLSSAQSRAKSYMQLTNETVAMLKLFTEALSETFTKPEIVVRLAHMLDYNLDALVGPKQAQLRIENPEEFGWNPRQMLAEITDVFLNLKDQESFVNAVATDGRSYKPENFDAAYRILESKTLKSDVQLKQWKELGEKVKVAKLAADEEEADLGDIPAEFEDPLMATLMENPVLLPESRQIVDLSTIRSHLLSDPHDPFNRMPLTIEQVTPDTELQAKIQAWKAERLAQKVAERNAAKAGEPMDTS
ncbi:hypothetical protein K491DRAFT_585674 [Lophiostoma macrostomum CBS 122681]|uniref:U-box domain-containing protein n=1 Tax=Lophiostoma macrostomum CBS 122681 TaxID=1314788 RepID=A0A6A6TTQ2_9PLEO|nr:hypothetical protein K491DRAFT_585674 [Lophiostoma macrostomum CBS 122681]